MSCILIRYRVFIGLAAGPILLLMAQQGVSANPALEGYANQAQFAEQVQQLDRFDHVQVRSLGKSIGGRDIWVLTLGFGEVDRRPAVAVIGNVHGPHLAGGELALRMARQLAEQAEKDEAVKKLLTERTIYFIPRPTSDASEKCFQAPYRERAGNDRKTDDDRDFQAGEDPPNDLNGDGWITQMRIEDVTGTWMPHPDDERILIQVDRSKNERGRWRVLVEGTDDDKDEQWNEDPGDGVALNRNLPFRYETFAVATGANAVSEPESRFLVDFLFDHPNIGLVLSFSPDDNLFHPWKPNQQAEQARIKTTVLSADAPLFEFLAGEYRKIHGGSDLPETSPQRGSFPPWAYFHYGRWSLTARGWWVPKVDPPKPAEGAEAKKPSGEKRGAEELNVLRWLEREKIDGFVNWTAVEHPDFPGKKVEVGGFKPFYRLNPPAKELDALAEKHVKYLTALPQWLPQLSITESKAENLGGGTVRISATVANTAYLPTMPEMGRVNGEAFPLLVELVLPKDTVFLQGDARGRLPRLEGSGGKAERTWLVRFSGEIPKSLELKVSAPSIGTASQMIEIK